ncbi:MAG: MerR family transcriptional regulator [Actinomycetota bacterium]|nr:MerR family transcriptional regulator [Actinomycetota bacterium]MDA3004619.1 MerR family transcriptional regulator [Actinomycetota bacterium]
MQYETQAVYVISVAAELAGMHPQTLRIYERRGLVQPARTAGGKQRRYSNADIAQLLRIAELAELGMNLEGIRQVMALEIQVAQLKHAVAQLQNQLERALENSHTKYGLVPLNQTAMFFGRTPSVFDEER